MHSLPMDHLCLQSGTAPHPPKASFWLLTSSQPVKSLQENVQTPQCGPPRAHVIRPLLPHLVFLTDFFSSSHAPPSPNPSLRASARILRLFPLSTRFLLILQATFPDPPHTNEVSFLFVLLAPCTQLIIPITVVLTPVHLSVSSP